MATNYPSSLDTFDTIASDKKTSDVVGGRTHRDMHNDLADAVEAVQAELGVAPSGSFSTVKARLDSLAAYGAKTGAYTATVDDNTINVTSGTFTLDLPAASTCTGKTLKVKNSGTGVVTLDGDSSETVEGIATFPLGPDSYVEITSTGSAWILTGGVPSTGWRNVVSLLSGSWATTGIVRMRRDGDRVTFKMNAVKGESAITTRILTLPAGFKLGTAATINAVWFEDQVSGAPAWTVMNGDNINTTWGGMFSGAAWSTGRGLAGEQTWFTGDAWPTSLPGSAV